MNLEYESGISFVKHQLRFLSDHDAIDFTTCEWEDYEYIGNHFEKLVIYACFVVPEGIRRTMEQFMIILQ